MQDVTIWEDQTQLQEVKQIYGQNLDDGEWRTFLAIGKATGLNPFLREIYAVKYGNQKASIFIGRDGYRKSAQANEDYDYHTVDAVYDNDEFKMIAGEPNHQYKLKDRGSLVGAYCIVKRKSASKAMYVFVEFVEYYAGHKESYPDGKIKTNSYGAMKPTVWDTKPATMIKKVAEAQALRMAFQDIFAGTYDESEDWETKEVKPVKDEIVIDQTPVALRTEEQMTVLQDLFTIVAEHEGVSIDKIAESTLKALFKISDFQQLTEANATSLIAKLEKKVATYEKKKAKEQAVEVEVVEEKENLPFD